MDTWILKQLSALVMNDLLNFIPASYFDQEISTFSLEVPNSKYLAREMSWGILAGRLGESLHFESPIGMTPKQVSASELLMNLGLLASVEAAKAAAMRLSEAAKKVEISDGNAGCVAEQLAQESIPTLQNNIKGALEQYLKYLPEFEQKPFLSLLENNKAPNCIQPTDASNLISQPDSLTIANKTMIDISTHTFKIALSFSGAERTMVEDIARSLVARLGPHTVFYDHYYQSQLARPSLDMLLQEIYKTRANLIVAFISSHYQEKNWCGVELRVINEILLEKNYNKVMFFRTDDGDVDGILKTDGYIDSGNFSIDEMVEFIIERVALLSEPVDGPPKKENTLEIVNSDNKIIGKWDLESAKRIANIKINNASWELIAPDIMQPLQHDYVGEYNLAYQNKEGMILIFGTIEEGNYCHVCAPFLSFFEFEKNENRWNLITTDIGIYQAGAWGRSPELFVAPIAKEKYGLFLKHGYTAQGSTICSISIHVRIGDKFKEVLNLLTAESDDEGCGWESKLLIRSTMTGFYDIEVQRWGLNNPDDLVLSQNITELQLDVADYDNKIRPNDIFKFDGQKYVRDTQIGRA